MLPYIVMHVSHNSEVVSENSTKQHTEQQQETLLITFIHIRLGKRSRGGPRDDQSDHAR